MKKRKIVLALIVLIASAKVVNAGTYTPETGYYYQHNAVTYGAKTNKVQNTFLDSTLTKNTTWKNYFLNGFNKFEDKDSSGTNARSFNLNVYLTTNSNISQADVLLSAANTDKTAGLSVPCVITNGKHDCSVAKYGGNANVHYYKIYIYKNEIESNIAKASVPAVARFVSAHEYGHTLGMGHFINKSENGIHTKSYKSIMGYNTSKYDLTTNDVKRLQNIYGK